MKKLSLESQDCELLALYSEHGSLTSMGEALGIDKGQLSRKISRLASLAPVLVRVQGKWSLTPQGQQIVQWYRDAVTGQEAIFQGKEELILATTQAISERKCAPIISEIIKETDYRYLKILTNLDNIESALFSGTMDFAITCAIPQSPEIRYKKIYKSGYVVITPPTWKEMTLKELMKLPYVSHTGIQLRALLGIENEIPHPAAAFDHLVGVRQGVISGLGWAVLPDYAVDWEIKEKKLKVIKCSQIDAVEEFQLWWIPGKVSKKNVQKLTQLLSDHF